MGRQIHIKSISQLHEYLGLSRPTHPLITVFPHTAIQGKVIEGAEYKFDLYQISLKSGIEGQLGYGRSTYDFEDGSLVFLSPGQVARTDNVQVSSNASPAVGWTLLFHPDLFRHSEFARKMEQYTFFHYEVNEALHVSDKEIDIVTDITQKIEYECSLNMDRHTQALILSNLELLLNYCVRFYDRQFYVRSALNKNYVSKFESFLHDYYLSDKPLEQGIPSVQYCGKELGLSPYYLSDLLKRETGKSALEFIHLFLINKAKSLMLDDELSITQIAYDLGFEYPQHFSKLFKSKIGMSPREFKSQQLKH